MTAKAKTLRMKVPVDQIKIEDGPSEGELMNIIDELAKFDADRSSDPIYPGRRLPSAQFTLSTQASVKTFRRSFYLRRVIELGDGRFRLEANSTSGSICGEYDSKSPTGHFTQDSF